MLVFRTFKRENTDYFRWICCMRRPTEVFYQTNLVFLSAQFSFLLEYSSTVSCWCMSVRLAEYDAVEALQVQGNREVLSHDGSIHLLQLRKNIFQTRTHQFSWKTPLPRHPFQDTPRCGVARSFSFIESNLNSLLRRL